MIHHFHRFQNMPPPAAGLAVGRAEVYVSAMSRAAQIWMAILDPLD
jgi:hypothetical protein